MTRVTTRRDESKPYWNVKYREKSNQTDFSPKKKIKDEKANKRYLPARFLDLLVVRGMLLAEERSPGLCMFSQIRIFISLSIFKFRHVQWCEIWRKKMKWSLCVCAFYHGEKKSPTHFVISVTGNLVIKKLKPRNEILFLSCLLTKFSKNQ